MSSLPLTQHPAAAPPEEARPSFFYDLGDVESYLAAERVNGALPVVPEWIPVDAGALPQPPGAPDRAAVAGRAREHGLQELRWPATWPPRSRDALVAATYAKQTGRAVAFSLAAFRQAFAAGRDLGDRDTVLLAGAACELHPNALLKALERDALAAALDAATAAAAAAGVRRVPAVVVGGEVFDGDAGVDAAARALGGTGAAA
jgi:2-hydroxychromene-2-carboxylate isomerase